MYSYIFPIQALNFILLICRSLVQSYFFICSILVASVSVILILQVLCWYPDQQLQNWQGLKLRPASVGKARPPMLLQHLKLAPALQPSQMHFSVGLKSKEEAEVQLVSRLCPPRLSPRLEGKCSVLGLLVGPLPWKGQQIKMTEDRAAGKLVSCTWSALWCGGLTCILKLKKLLSHYSKC